MPAEETTHLRRAISLELAIAVEGLLSTSEVKYR